MSERRRHRDQRGETLLESLLSVFILSMVGIAAYAGYSLVIQQTTEHKSNGSGTALLRSAAEQLQSPDVNYIPRARCSGASNYAIPAPKVVASGWTVTVTDVKFWQGAPLTP